MANPTNNFGDQIVNAVQDAIDKQDFSALSDTVGKTVNAAAEGIGRGIANAQVAVQKATDAHAQAMQKAVQDKAQANALAEQKAQMDSLYASSGNASSLGLGIAVVGGVIGIPAMFFALVCLAISSLWPVAIPLIILGVAGIAGLIFGVMRIGQVSTFSKYRDIIGVRPFCYIDELASRTQSNSETVRKNLKAMIKAGLFKQAKLDDSESYIIMTADAYQEYCQARSTAMQKQQQSALADSVTPGNEVPAAISPKVQDILDRGDAYLAKLRESSDAISDKTISAKVDDIEKVVQAIFARVKEKPELAGDLGKLMDYYLPTTVKLLDAYRDLDSQPIQSESIGQSKREISNTLDTLTTAFNKLLDSLFKDMTWDVSTDISVLHTVLAQEGLTSSPLDPKAQ